MKPAKSVESLNSDFEPAYVNGVLIRNIHLHHCELVRVLLLQPLQICCTRWISACGDHTAGAFVSSESGNYIRSKETYSIGITSCEITSESTVQGVRIVEIYT